MADRVMHIARVRLGDVLVPLASAVSAPRDVGRDRLIQIIRDHNYSRLPLLEPDGQVCGILDIYEVLLDNGDVPAGDRARPPLVLGIETGVTDALYQLQRSRTTLAVVADPAGKHVGIVTVKDLVEEIVGELAAW